MLLCYANALIRDGDTDISTRLTRQAMIVLNYQILCRDLNDSPFGMAWLALITILLMT